MNIFKLFTGDKKTERSSSSIYSSIYPEAIRYALQYKNAQMGKAEIRSLLDRYLFETVYMVTKALASDRQQQCQFLQDVIRIYANKDWTEAELRDLLKKYIVRLPDDVSIDGAKLAQLNRFDQGAWQTAFRDLALKALEADNDKMPVVILHTPILALHHFVQIFAEIPAQKFLLLNPKWMEDPDNPLMGYKVDLTGNPVVVLQELDTCIFGEWQCHKHECKLHNQYCGKSIFIDDTIKTGATAQRVRSFWEGEYGKIVPEDRIRVITNLRDKDQAGKLVF